jgi:hypothetical protein
MTTTTITMTTTTTTTTTMSDDSDNNKKSDSDNYKNNEGWVRRRRGQGLEAQRRIESQVRVFLLFFCTILMIFTMCPLTRATTAKTTTYNNNNNVGWVRRRRGQGFETQTRIESQVCFFFLFFVLY